MSSLGTILMAASRSAGGTPHNRIRTALDERTYPVTYRPRGAPEPELPFVFRKLPDDILTGLPFAAALGARPGAVPKEKLFDLHNESYDRLEALNAECAAMLLAIVKCNTQVRSDWMNDKRKFEAMTRKVEEWAALVPKFEFDRERVLGVELYLKSEVTITAKLHFTLADACHALVRNLAHNLDRMIDLEQVGLIEWAGESACWYSFYRNVVFSEVTAERRKAAATVRDLPAGGREVVRETVTRIDTERDVETTYKHAREVHEVIAAKNLALEAAKGVKRPERIDQLIAAIPAWLKPAMRVVTGKETSRLVIERDLATERATEHETAETVRREYIYRPDPALVCGMYVFSGWDDDETSPPARTPKVLAPKAPLSLGPAT